MGLYSENPICTEYKDEDMQAATKTLKRQKLHVCLEPQTCLAMYVYALCLVV